MSRLYYAIKSHPKNHLRITIILNRDKQILLKLSLNIHSILTCKVALEISRFPSADTNTLWSCCNGDPCFNQDILGAGAAAGGEQRSDAADPASTEAEVGETAKGFLRSVKDDFKVSFKYSR